MSVELQAASRVAEPGRRSAPNRRTSLRAMIRRGLLDRRRAILTWGLALGSLSAFMAAIYIHAEMFNLIVPLAMGYFAIPAVADPTVGVEERGYLDTILALPVSRTVLIAGNYLVAAVACAAIMALTGAMTFIVGRLAGTDISLGLVAAGVIGVWPLAMLFGGVAALASGCLHNARTVTGLSVGILVAMYALDVAGRLASGLGAIRWMSAFRYYGAPMRDGIDPASLIGLSAVGLLLVIAGALLLERRDVLH